MTEPSERKPATTPLEAVSCALEFFTKFPERWVTGTMKTVKADDNTGELVYCFCAIGKLKDCIAPIGYRTGEAEDALINATAEELGKDISTEIRTRSTMDLRSLTGRIITINDYYGYDEVIATFKRTKERLSIPT